MPRPRNMDERKSGGWGAYVWSHYLLADSEPHCNDRLGRTLKALAQESTKRISVSTSLRYGTNNNVDYKTAGQRNAWYNYFVAAFEKILRELPPPDASAEQVREKRREFHQQRRLPPPVVQYEAAVATATPPDTQPQPVANSSEQRGRKRSWTDSLDDDDDGNAANTRKRAKKEQEPTRDNFIVYIPANVKVVLVPEGPADATFCIKSESSTASMSMSSTGTSSAAEDTLPASPPSVPLFPPMRWSACPSMDSLSSDTYSQDQRPSPAQGSKEPSPAQDSNSLSLSLAGYNINIPYALDSSADHTATPAQRSRAPAPNHNKPRCNIQFGLYTVCLQLTP
ncbi:uncharacterized protein B0T23DRAFT_372106 [Neurospora hispaniola]|uniref:Uncharacterized protein n=1 Tax=Neurospora hispaniola TaxID=588809 RepID=A0AAJ0IHE7_9PEZI|nr:hypothetical protein B0T23DRAFT_372106 [Neurospora hispaniola]